MDSSDDDIIFSNDETSLAEDKLMGSDFGNHLKELEREGVSIIGNEETENAQAHDSMSQDLFLEEGIEILPGEEENL